MRKDFLDENVLGAGWAAEEFGLEVAHLAHGPLCAAHWSVRGRLGSGI